MSTLMRAIEIGIVPDPAIRFGIRKLCKDRLRSLTRGTRELEQNEANEYIARLKSSPLAVHTEQANEQHYELPPEFFTLVLGRHRKYSSAYWDQNCTDLDQAEEHALDLTMSRAELKNGMNILELGCGWGSLTLSMAERFPGSQITALSNSAPQREWIEAEASSRNLKNVRVITRNITEVEDLSGEFGQFDRIVSVEMFEHLRNYELLLAKISKWLKPEGKLFVHIFTHKQYSYLFETEGAHNWMGRYFFTGGQMPAHHLLSHFQNNLVLSDEWIWDGTHYAMTAEAWLTRMDANRARILEIFNEVYGPKLASVWVQRWRVFFMSCAELFRYKNGKEWGVSHYLFLNKT